MTLSEDQGRRLDLARISRIRAILYVAALYYFWGRVALLLAIPPGYATAVWPAAGIALAGVLLLGNRVWPGIWIGSILVNFATGWNSSSSGSMLRSASVAALIAVGATLQALWGGFLVRRVVGYPKPFAGGKDVVQFLLLGGPLACLLSASVGVTCLFAMGSLPGPNCLFSWWTWWIGDTIGVLTVAPLALVWARDSRDAWHRRRITVLLPIGLALCLVVAFFGYARRWEEHQSQLEFERRTDALAQMLVKGFEEDVDVLLSIEAFFDSTPSVSRQEFHEFVGHLLVHRPGLQALSWDVRMTEDERAHYEQTARREGLPTFRITEQAASGRLIPARPADEHVAVYYVEPHLGNERALGYDVASDPIRREALTRAARTGRPVATAGLILVQEARNELGFVVYRPIYRKLDPQRDSKRDSPASAEERQTRLVGFAAGVFRARDLMLAALAGQDRTGIDLLLVDQNGNGTVLLDPQSTRRTQESGNQNRDTRAQRSVSLEMAGRQWRLTFTLGERQLLGQRSWATWSILAGGLLFTGLLGALLLVVTGSTERVRDLVQKRTAELKASEAGLSEAQEIARLGSWEWNPTTNEVTWSDELHRLYALERGAFGATYESFLAQVHPEDCDLVRGAVERTLRDHQPFSFEHRVLLSDGTIRTLHARGRVMLGADGQPSRLVGTGQDISERKELQAQLLLADRMVSLGTLAAGVAHEINNPLGALIAFLHLTAKNLPAETAAEPKFRVLEAILDAQKCADRIRLIVRDLQVFARADEQGTAVLDPRQVLEATLKMTANEIRHRATVLKLFGEIPTVRANEARLGQVFLNLVVNAFQAVSEGAVAENQITLCTRTDERGWAIIEVSDTGCGISQEVLKRIFDPFFTTKPVGSGIGLGLSICHGIVTTLGGEISVESRLGQGSTFRVCLPAAVKEVEEQVVLQPVEAAPPIRRRILVVDDEPDLVKSLALFFSDEHEVTAVTSGQEACDLLQQGEFDLVLCDLMMPGVTGMDVFERIKAARPGLERKLIFMTGGAFTNRSREFLATISNPHLEKPFDLDRLEGLMAEHLKSS